jgi:hypothetical protein
MSYKHVGTAADLVRFRCSLKVECTACGAAHTMTGIEVTASTAARAWTVKRAAMPGAWRALEAPPSQMPPRCRLKVARLTVLPPV